MSKDWIVSEIRLSTDAKKYGVDRVLYPYYVLGTYGPECGTVGREFYWNLPKASLENPRYDLTQLTLDERPAPRLALDVSALPCPAEEHDDTNAECICSRSMRLQRISNEEN